MLGRPRLEITIVIEPTRRRDVLQTPGLFDGYRQVLAKRSIVNPGMNVIIAAPTDESVPARLNAPLTDAVRAMLHDARPIARSADGIVFNATELWTPNKNWAIVVFSVPNAEERTTHLTTYGEVRAGDCVVAMIAQPFVTARGVAAASGTRSEVLRLDLPPGTYEGAFALVDDRTKQPLLSVAAPLRVLDAKAKFDVSSLLLAGEPLRGKSEFTFGEISVRPRADLLYRRGESMWYFAVIRSEAGSNGITVDIQLRRDGKPIAARTFTPRMDAIAPEFFLLGEELPLQQFSSGDYSLYVVVHGAGGATEVRRADFRVGL
jgi:hypothetical protein